MECSDGARINSTCALYNASYTVQFMYTGGVQSTNITSLDYISRLDYKGALRLHDDEALALGSFSYGAIWMAMIQQLTSMTITKPVSTGDRQRPLIGSRNTQHFSRSLSSLPLLPNEYGSNKTLSSWFEELSQNITLSLFGASELWSNQSQKVNATIFEAVNVYEYNALHLLTSYGIGATVALIGIIVGFHAYRFNDYTTYDDSFSTVLRATRNEDLNSVVEEQLADSRVQSRVRLQYGLIGGGKGRGVLSLGLPGTVTPLKRGALSSR
ncbi:MAG: hypothetical protein M1819_006848 [Sarea resinae]|nr:MAG: hypothetical protein M1819_006848 [Sarea resinae]